MEEDACGVSYAFSFPYRGGSEGDWKGLGGEDIEEVKGCGGRIGWEKRLEGRVCAQGRRKCREHFSRETWMGPAEKAYGFLRKPGE